MTPTIDLDRWLAIVDENYLGDYLRAGGSSVKFVVCYEQTSSAQVSGRIEARARSREFLTARVPSEQVKVHLIEKLFGSISDQLPWSDLTTRVLCKFAQEQHWEIPTVIDPGRGLVEQLDERNGLGRQQISLVLQRECLRAIVEDRSLAKDFRVAMTWLARGRLDAGANADVALQQITDWLGGRVSAISNMHPYQIYSKVTRANARHLFASLLAWVRKAGFPGLVTVLDAQRIVAAGRSTDGTLNYSTAAMFDAYEVLRQFIDATDEFDGFLLVVLVPAEFLDFDPPGKGVARYPALMGRIYDEVRDQRLANPFGALTRLDPGKEAA